MYYVAFFPDFRPLVKISLSRFLQNDLDSTWINHNGKSRTFTSDTVLPGLEDDPIFLPNLGEPQSWYIHGQEIDQCNGKDFKFPLLNGTSLEEIDRLFKDLSCKYSWCFFPWGSVGSFFGFAFVSSDRHFRDQFIDIVENLELTIQYLNTPNCKPRPISSYNVDKNIGDLIQCIIFNINNDYLGNRIWELCENSSDDPLLVSNNLNYPVKDNLFNYNLELNISLDDLSQIRNNATSVKSGINRQDDTDFFWKYIYTNADNNQELCTKIGTLKCLDESKATVNVFEIEQWLYETFFNQACQYYSKFSPIAEIIVPYPKLNDFTFIRNIISVIGYSRYALSDDIIMMPEILNQTEWMFGVCRPLENGESNSIFMGKNSIVHKFMNINCYDDFSLISCF